MSGEEWKKLVLVGASAFLAGIGTVLALKRFKPAKKGGSLFSGINRPTAGARSQKALPVGSHPIQLHSLATPNGQKVTILFEELEAKYDAYPVDIMKGDQFTTGFVEINPNSKIPALRDTDGPGGKPIRIFESGSILLYYADKYGKFIPKDPALRVECQNWLFFQMGAAPFFGQFGHFYKYADTKIEYGIERYKMETKRIVDVLDKQLADHKYLVGDEYTIADIAWWPWIRCLGNEKAYNARTVLELDSYQNVTRWFNLIASRPAVQKGILITSTQPGGIREYHSSL